ncbi:TniQ family protein [Aurantimonas coralicida]|uniref:TniQ family protein n=1 Tax=Aurantimonas coralicida TaxID=182270 RepID=UPI001D18DBE8|nr:TniQ family protein [Aurantimonas coralicida]MCC4297213.1 TniQ family protein [Aurantimonas coralicida]
MRPVWCPPLRLYPNAGEDALSYLVRWGVRNGEWNSVRFAANIGVSVDGLRTGRQVGIMESAARLSEGTLAAWSPKTDTRSRTIRIGADVIRMQDWSASARRWCPACFASDRDPTAPLGGAEGDGAPWHRAVWNLAALEKCPEHGTALRSCCPSCGSAQDWDHAPLDTCACGARLQSEKFSVGDADGLSTFVANRVRGATANGPRLLDGLPLGRCLPLLERLGLSELGKPGARWASVRASGAARCTARGYEIASSWPRRFIEVLDGIVAARGVEAISHGGMTLTYGWVHEHWINPMPSDDAGRMLKAALLDHATAHGIVSEYEMLLGREASTSSLTLSQAASELGMGHARARRLLVRREALPAGRRRSVGMTIDRREVERLRQERARRIDARTARGRLGLGKIPFRGLVMLGLLVPADDGHGNERFQGSDVERLLERIRGSAPITDTVAEGCMALPEASRKFGVSIAELVRRIATSELCVHGSVHGGGALSAVFVQASDLIGPACDGKNVLTLQEASAKLWIHPEAVLHVARAGLLAGSREGRAWSFSAVAVDAFDAAHVSNSRIAASVAASPRSTIARLAGMGIRPVVGPPTCRQAIFARSAAEQALGITCGPEKLSMQLSNDGCGSSRRVR